MSDSREEFEDLFPVPEGVRWHEGMNDYTYTDIRGLNNCCSQSKAWRAWQAGRQSEGGDAVAYADQGVLDGLALHRANDFPAGGTVLATNAGGGRIPLYTHPPKDQGVPEGEAQRIARKWLSMNTTYGGNLHYDDITKMAEALLSTTPQPDKPEWIRFEGEFDHPTEKLADEAGNIWAFDGVIELIGWQDFNPRFHTHYRPTGLTRPTPPADKEKGDE